MVAELYQIPNAVFVFGSNTAGIHGAGAAAHAHQMWGATWGKGEGLIYSHNLERYSYALPTKDDKLETLSLSDIKIHVNNFLDIAFSRRDLLFIVTPFGTGLAGHSKGSIWDIILESGGPSRNMLFTASWMRKDVT